MIESSVRKTSEPGVSQTRVIHDPNQVLTPEEIQIGNIYIRHYSPEVEERAKKWGISYLIALTEPILKEGKPRVTFREIRIGKNPLDYTEKDYLSDLGIIPYVNNQRRTWNLHN